MFNMHFIYACRCIYEYFSSYLKNEMSGLLDTLIRDKIWKSEVTKCNIVLNTEYLHVRYLNFYRM